MMQLNPPLQLDHWITSLALLSELFLYENVLSSHKKVSYGTRTLIKEFQEKDYTQTIPAVCFVPLDRKVSLAKKDK